MLNFLNFSRNPKCENLTFVQLAKRVKQAKEVKRVLGRDRTILMLNFLNCSKIPRTYL